MCSQCQTLNGHIIGEIEQKSKCFSLYSDGNYALIKNFSFFKKLIFTSYMMDMVELSNESFEKYISNYEITFSYKTEGCFKNNV